MPGRHQKRYGLHGSGDAGRSLLFHPNPDKAAELGRNGGQRRKHAYDPLCYQESCLPELLSVLRIRFGRPCTVQRAGVGVLGTPKHLKRDPSREVAGNRSAVLATN